MASKNGYKTSELFAAQSHLYKHIQSHLMIMSIKWAVELGIPDIIKNQSQPITLPQLISALQVPQSKVSCVQRLMRLLAHNNFFVITKETDSNNETTEAYGLTPSSELLVKGTDHSLSSMVEFLSYPTIVDMFHHLGKWTFSEEPTLTGFVLGSGGYWNFMQQNPSYLKRYNEAMESDSHLIRSALKDCKFVFDGLDSMVDVGGGTGTMAKIICEAFPNLKYTVLDLPQVVAGLTGTNNLSFFAGSMFDYIPEADAILIKWVLHNWGDDECIKVLKNCKEAISGKGKRGKVIIIDIVIDTKQDEHDMTELKLFLDIGMMTVHSGKERDENEWKGLFKKAGFQHYKIFPLFGFRSLIELSL